VSAPAALDKLEERHDDEKQRVTDQEVEVEAAGAELKADHVWVPFARCHLYDGRDTREENGKATGKR